ncbi:MAG: hypothetical protein Q4F12_03430 [Erysipelotrichaceae bacterium]|nr:hypothetical protein [Erysipelotrichaceae bacterium]
MKTNDYRYDQELFKSFIGKTFNKYKHEKFLFTNTVTQVLGFMINNESYKMNNDFEQVDFMGWDNEATICRVNQTNWDNILVNRDDIIETEINKEIKSITLINDHFVSKTYGSVNYDWWETRAVIFNFGELEVSFEKQDSFFSMEIEINKGYDLINKVEDGKFILSDFEQSEEQTIEVSREIINLK